MHKKEEEEIKKIAMDFPLLFDSPEVFERVVTQYCNYMIESLVKLDEVVNELVLL